MVLRKLIKNLRNFVFLYIKNKELLMEPYIPREINFFWHISFSCVSRIIVDSSTIYKIIIYIQYVFAYIVNVTVYSVRLLEAAIAKRS